MLRHAAAILFLAFSLLAAAQSGAPVARPEVKVDDRWVYRGTDRRRKPPTSIYEVRVSFVDSKVIHAVVARQGRRDDSDATWTAEWNAPRAGAFHVRHERKVTVVGWEDIEVPAGRFRALKLQAEGHYRRVDRAAADEARNTFWYAPRVKRWVKHVYRDNQLEVIEELYFYRVQ